MSFECGQQRSCAGLGTARVTRSAAGADEPYEGILHVRVCGGVGGNPGSYPAANAGERLGFAGKSRVALSPRPAWLSSGVSCDMKLGLPLLGMDSS